MKRLLLVVVLVGITKLPAVAQPDSFRFEQLEGLQEAERRPVVVFISADWCRYCSRMKMSTLQDERVVKLLNESFYFVSLNAEEKKDTPFYGHTFKYRPTGNETGVHELAEQLGSINGHLSFPTLSVLNADMEIIYQHGGYLSAKELSTILALVKKEQKK
ncbi:thioredoxin family protein [Pontibacter diazotrophicus]|uniref:Thioredoxin family protein n=1 Tax=Pontibacter diazotrophicus TaxID=1400979 RepID=A0A3D8KZ36_9BACT|nr:thioredoxin family protein [Pontibacter diazotrophicus]RDV10373.1 thioredoxin family protein [Pontibacter diazotrophicus]